MKIFVIAGEASGDQLGASIIHELAKRHPQLNIRGIGGTHLKQAGLSESLFPMHELSIMGVAEILPHIPKILRRITQAVTAIKLFNPDIILTIDSPDFTFRVLEKIKNLKIKSKRIHVVAPSVWAWRAGRAEQISKFLDGLLCLLPFEPALFEKYGLKSCFMGHPVMQSGVLTANGSAFRFSNMIGAAQPTCGLFFGSRKGELDRHQSLFLDTAESLQKENSDLVFIIPTLPRYKERLSAALSERNLKSIIVDDKNEKWNAIAACDIALNVSGTIGLELSVANIPHIMAYKFHPISFAIGKMLVKTKYGHLTNILQNQPIIPEFLQDQATAEAISAYLKSLFDDKELRQKQRDAFENVRQQLTADPQKKSAELAADFIESFVK